MGLCILKAINEKQRALVTVCSNIPFVPYSSVFADQTGGNPTEIIPDF